MTITKMEVQSGTNAQRRETKYSLMNKHSFLKKKVAFNLSLEGNIRVCLKIYRGEETLW